jgi:hypothetical protein
MHSSVEGYALDLVVAIVEGKRKLGTLSHFAKYEAKYVAVPKTIRRFGTI